MKKIQFCTLILLIVFSLNSCLKDKGSYEYKDINEVTISGLNEKVRYDLYTYVDTLKIDVDVSGTISNDETDYVYEWKLVPASESNTADSVDYVIGNSKNLNFPITLDPGEYTGYFNVTDKSQGTRWSKIFKVLVRSLTSEGYLILSDQNNKGRLDLISTLSESDYIVAYDLWREEDYSHLGKPLNVFFNYNRYDMSSTLYVTENGTHRLDKNLKTSDRMNLKWLFGGDPERVDIRGMNSTSFLFSSTTNKEFMVDNSGNLYGRDPVIIGAMFEYPINKIAGTTAVNISTQIGVPISSTSNHSVLLYDNTNKQFLEIRNNNLYPTVMRFQNTGLFTAVTNRDLLFVQTNLTKNTISILKDPSQHKFYIYGIELGANGTNTQKLYLELLTANQEEIKQFAIHPSLPYVFYSTANKVYQFDYSQPTLAAKLMIDYGAQQVKTIDFFPLVGWNPYTSWERNKPNILVVGVTNNLNEGTVEFFNVPTLGAALQKKASLGGFGNIIDIAQRER